MRKSNPVTRMLAGRVIAALLLCAALLQNNALREPEPVHIYPDEEAAPLHALLQHAMGQSDGESHPAIVIHSDGFWPESARTPIEVLNNAGVPVYWQARARKNPAAPVIAVDMPDIARPGQRISISIDVAELPERKLLATIREDLRVLASAVLEAPRTVLEVPVDSDYSLALDLEISDAATGETVLARQSIGVVNVLAAPRLLLVTSQPSMFGASLARGGWPLSTISPQEFPAYAASLGNYRALILDDVAWHDLARSDWQHVARSVRDAGLSLIVSGGPNSFALGAYRGTELEALLPLVSEPPEREPAARVALLLDVSGSMNRNASRRLNIARRAVMESVQALRPIDQVGLYTFDVAARRLLPIAARADHATALANAWPATAGGGTQVLAALELAIADLRTREMQQQLIFLVTDGMLSESDIATVSLQIAGTPIQLVALLIADGEDDVPLHGLAESQQIRVLTVDDISQLPALMRSELESLGPALIAERTRPARADWSPAFADGAWPALAAYTQTRARPNARIKLHSPAGDPLLAEWSVGSARVVALPGGLGDWAREWLAWEHWPAFAADLVTSVASFDARAIKVLPQSADQAVSIDVASVTLEQPVAQILRASETAQLATPQLIAPRRYRISVPGSGLDGGTLLWRDGNLTARYALSRRSAFPAIAGGASLAHNLQSEGTLKTWRAEENRQPASFTNARAWLAALALFVFVLTIALERLPWGAWRLLAPAQNR